MIFGEYERIDEIGHGASGYVYKVKKENDFFALKACTGMYPEALKRFDREIRIAQSLNHPNVIHVYDYDMGASNPYFVMDLCEDSIARHIKGKTYEELLSLSVEVCEGIKALHEAGIIHRDIKPGNILMKNGVVRITDFSFGSFVDHDSTTLTTSSQIVGTQGYIAPEIVVNGGHQATIQSDIYSLGCTLWFIFSGGVDPSYYKAQVINPNIVRIIEKCRDNEPIKRYSSVKELIEELKALQTPVQYLSIKDLKANEQGLTMPEFRINAFQLLMKNDRWDELIADIRQLKGGMMSDIIKNIPGAGGEILLLLENVYNNDTDNWKQFEDVETYADICAMIFSNSTDVLAKQKTIDMTLEFAINYNRWPAMRIIKDKMINKLTDDEVRNLSGFLKSKKALLESLESSLGTILPKKVRLVAGLV